LIKVIWALDIATSVPVPMAVPAAELFSIVVD